MNEKTVTGPQLRIIAALLSEIKSIGTDRDRANCVATEKWVEEQGLDLPRAAASQLIDKLLNVKRVREANAPAPVSVASTPTRHPKDRRSKVPPLGTSDDALGAYRDPDTDTLWQVKRSLATKHLYARRIVPPKRKGGAVQYEFVSGAIYKIQPSWRLTEAEAVKYSELIGACCVCGRRLKRSDSVAAGIGPVCRSRLRTSSVVPDIV